MILLSTVDYSLPLTNPVIIFSLVLFIILFAPILFNQIKIPPIIGLIIAGMLVGPYGFNLLLRDSSIVLFGTVGLIYIMFTAALEIDLEEFKKNRVKSLVFGLFTFVVPIIIGFSLAYFGLNFSLPSSILIASMLSTHTLLAYPIVSRYGISGNRSVTLTVGGTIIADILALLVLAAVTGMTRGDISAAFWIKLGIGCVLFACIIFFLFPLIARWFFKNFEDSISQYIFVLGMVFLGSFLAEAAGLEAIIGAFLSGLALNRFIPHLSPLMNRIDFVGNAFFIPFFLIGVGMLVDVSVLFKGLGAIKVAAIMIAGAVLSKYIAALLTQKTFRLSREELNLIFGLSNARVGATLAIVLVGYNIILAETETGEPIRLLNEDVLNGAVLMILVTCAISSFVVEKAAKVIALKEESPKKEDTEIKDKILISLAYPETVTELVDFGLMLKPHKSNVPVYALHVTSDEKENENQKSSGKKILDKALNHASSTENVLVPITRYDVDISHGIIYTIKEHAITDVLIGLHHKSGENEFFGKTAENIFNRISDTVYIYKPCQPFNTLKRMVILVSPNAEFEPGFRHWYEKVLMVAKASGMPVDFFASTDTLNELKKIQEQMPNSVKIAYKDFSNWEDFLIFSREIKPNDLFVIISSRKGHVSFNSYHQKLPYYLSNYFKNNSFIILYPKQSPQDMQHEDADMDTTAADSDPLKKLMGNFKNIFNR